MTYTGKVVVSDGMLGYAADLRGEWTGAEIVAAFADGYATRSDGQDWPEGEPIALMIYPQDGSDTILADARTLHADGRGGIREHADLGGYPHPVEWAA